MVRKIVEDLNHFYSAYLMHLHFHKKNIYVGNGSWDYGPKYLKNNVTSEVLN